jgi:gamma-glutamyl phosphate reductase
MDDEQIEKVYDYLSDAKDDYLHKLTDNNTRQVEQCLAGSLIAIAERLDKQNELLERIAKVIERIATGDDPMANSLNIYIAGDGR